MKQLHGSATVTVGATAERCLEVAADVGRYPSWYPEGVSRTETLAAGRDGLAPRARVKLHVSRGPLKRDFELLMEILIAPARVTLARVPHDASDQETFEVVWDVEDRGESRQVHLTIEASLEVPRFLPLGTIGDDLAADFVAAIGRVLQSEA